MLTRILAGKQVNPLGLGTMNITHGYSHFLNDAQAAQLLHTALDAGVNHLDTATLYGATRSEQLIGEHLAGRREEFFLASKGGLSVVEGRGKIDGRPATLHRQIDESLARLRTDHIDLYYLHRLDPQVPIEESVGALAEAHQAGKIGGIGLSEISVSTLHRAHAVHPIAAVQNEYSLATRNPELALLSACAELKIALVAFSPLYRGLLTGKLRHLNDLEAGDMRLRMPRFNAENIGHNLALVDRLVALAAAWDTTATALSLVWVLAQGEHLHVIPGTTKSAHLAENMAAANLQLSAEQLRQIGKIINQDTVAGHRYNPAQRTSIDSEEFDPSH